MKHKNTTKNSGFTLVEIMVVVAIIALLGLTVVPRVFSQLDRARETRVSQDIRAIEASLNFYRLDNFGYPTQAEGLQALVQAPTNARNWRGPYLESLPLDPWDREYRYANPGQRGSEIEVFTFGQDDAEGGEGANADLGSWNVGQ